MALEDIIKKIKDQAKREVSKIEKAKKKEIEDIAKKGEAEVVAEEKKLDKNLEESKKSLIEKANLQANIEERNKLVATKQTFLDKAFAAALEEISGMDDQEYINLVKSMIDDLPQLSKGEIVPVKNRSELVQEALSRSDKSYSLLDNFVEGKGGFVFRSNDVEIDNTFDSLLAGVREDLEVEVAKILFKEN